jgi:hypothetical protein
VKWLTPNLFFVFCIMKKSATIFSLLTLLVLAGCGSAPVELPVSSDSTFSLGQTYTI